MSHTRVPTSLGFVLLSALALPAGAQTVALTFDDGFDPRSDEQATQSNRRILDILQANRIRAMLFPAGVQVDSPAGLDLVSGWSRAGHLIGNHSYSHQALSTFPGAAPAFFQDVRRAEDLFKHLPGWCARLRFPYLDEGGSPEVKNEAVQWLAGHGYGVAPITIAIEDWVFNEKFVAASNNGHDAAGIQRDYVQAIWQAASTQEATWTKMLGRSPAHVLLLHTNALNTSALPEIVTLFRQQGWRFVDPVVAFADPIYSRAWTQDGQTRALPVPACR